MRTRKEKNPEETKKISKTGCNLILKCENLIFFAEKSNGCENLHEIEHFTVKLLLIGLSWGRLNVLWICD